MASSPDPGGKADKPPVTEELPMAEKHYPRLLVSNLNPRDSRVVLKQYFEGYEGGQLRVLDTEMFSTGERHSAIVTLDNPREEVQGILQRLHGEQLQVRHLCTESTTLTISNMKQDLQEKVFELARRWNVDCKSKDSDKLSLTGPIELVYHLRLELDTFVMRACGASNVHLLPDSVTPPLPVQSHMHQPASPPTAELPTSPPPPTSDSPHIFSNLSPEVLALLAKIPEGDLPGVQYCPKEGTVNIESRSKEELEDRISRFQTAYQGILGARKLKVEPVEVPPALDDAIAEQITASFNKQYNQCVFIYYTEPRVVKVVSTSSRQFDQAKKLLVEALASRPDPSVGAKVDFSHKEEVIVLPGGRKLTLKKANIVEEEVDVIVNAANSRLQHGGGVAGAINAASHGEVQKYSDRYLSRKGPVSVGQGAWTNAGGNLKCKFVFHAVGPDNSYTRNECERLLTQVVSVALLSAEKANHNSIAIPALSSGIFGVSKDLVARCVVDAIVNFRFTKASPVVSDIRIVIIDKPTYSCFARYFVQKRALLKQAPRKPLEPHESQSAGVGRWGHSNTSTTEPPSLERNTAHPPTSTPTTALPQGQSIGPKPEGSAKPPSPLPHEALTFDDLSMLNAHLRGVSKKWYSLGFHLGFTTDQLENLVSTVDVNRDPAVYLSKVLSAWLQRANPPTLEKLCRALSHEKIGEKELALHLLHSQRSQTTTTKGSKPASANAISNISAPVPANTGRKLAANFTKPAPVVLTPDDLSVLNEHLQGVSTKWQAFGFQLGFSTEALANLVPVDCDPAVCLIKVLSTWLQCARPPTLETLCRALSHGTVGEEELAKWLLHQSDCLQSAKREENTNATISYPVLPPDQSVEESGSSMSPYPNEHPPSSSHSSAHSQPSNEAHGAGMTSMPNTPAGSTAVPTTVTHTQPYHVPPGTDPLSSPGTAGQPAFTRSMSDPASSTWAVSFTATSGKVTCSQATAAGTGGGGVTASNFDTTAITVQPHKEDKHKGDSGGGNKGRGSHGQHRNKGGHKSSATGAAEEDKMCPICLDEFTNPAHTKCGHQFCSGCLKEALKYDPFCPTCKHPLRTIIGKQPVGGVMNHMTLYAQSLPGYQGYNTIQIDYWIPDGVQGPEHPNPGQRFSGTSRTAYLPDSHEGREVLKLLKKAFDARLIFTVGTSVTTGAQNTVVWNDIHHKTSKHGGPYGYPDPTYLQRVKDDLAAKGIVSKYSTV